MTKNKMNPGKGYRLLKEGEEIFETDEHWAHGEGPWIESNGYRGTKISKFHVPFRRKVEKPKGWNVTATLPTRHQARIFKRIIEGKAFVTIKKPKLNGPHKA